MIDIILQAFKYVTSDFYFWPSMTFTTMVGIFIGAVIYDGDVREVRKGLIALASYVLLLATVNLTRVIPEIGAASVPYKPIAGIVTMILVTVFYLFGMWLGVKITKRAHKGRTDLGI